MRNIFLTLFFIFLVFISAHAAEKFKPMIVESISNDYQLRAGPSTDFDRVAYLLKGTKFIVNKKTGDFLRLSTSPQNLWVNKDFVKILSVKTPPTYNIINYIETKDDENTVDVEFRMSESCAYSVNNYGDEIYMIFYNTCMNIFETRFELKSGLINDINVLENTENYVKVKIKLNIKRLFGYEVVFENKKLILKIRKPSQDISLKNKVIILDAGHGGDDLGAIGQNGLKEKDVNLAIVLKLKDLLIKDGANVILTRENDAELTPTGSPAADELQARCDVVKNNNGAISISIHNNSHPDEEKRKTLTNTDIYFYHPQSKPLADLIAKNLGKTLNKDNYFSLNRSFYLIRPSFAPSVLCEITFISNMQEEEKLKLDEYQQNAALGIFNGIKEYFNQTTDYRP